MRIQIPDGLRWDASQHFVNIGLKRYWDGTQTLRNAASEQEVISLQGRFVDTIFVKNLIPPTSHRIAGCELFDFIAEHNPIQLRAAVECGVVNRLDGGGDPDAF